MAKRARLPDKRVELAAVQRRVLRATLLIALYIPAAAIASAAVIGAILLGINRIYGSWGSAGNIVLYPMKGFWFLFSSLMGGCMAFLSAPGVHRRLLGPRPSLWIVEYEIASWPVPAHYRKVLVIALFLLSLVAAANVRAHAVLTESAIVEQQAFAVTPNRYPYSQIERIAMARHFIPAGRYGHASISKDRRLYIWLRDGTRWSLNDSRLFAVDEGEIAEYVAGRSGLAIESPEAAVDVPESTVLRRRARWALIFSFVPLLFIALIILALKRFVKRRAA